MSLDQDGFTETESWLKKNIFITLTIVAPWKTSFRFTILYAPAFSVILVAFFLSELPWFHLSEELSVVSSLLDLDGF